MKRYLRSNSQIQTSSLSGFDEAYLKELVGSKGADAFKKVINDMEAQGWSCKITTGYLTHNNARPAEYPKLNIYVPTEEWSDSASRKKTQDIIRNICIKYKLPDVGMDVPDWWFEEGSVPKYTYLAKKSGSRSDGFVRLTLQ